MSEREPAHPDFCEHGNTIGSCEVCSAQAANKQETKSQEGEGGIEAVEGAHQSNLEEERISGEWATIGTVAKELGRDYATVRKTAELYRATHPEWFARRLHLGSRGGRPAEHYAPELIAILREEFQKVPDAPAGWLTCAEISTLVNRKYTTIASRVDQYREPHPEWFKTLRHRNGKIFEYLSPDLIAFVTAEMARLELAPEGWMYTSALAEESSLSNGAVQRRAEQYRASHPEWFRQFLSPQTKVLEHFSPELVRRIKENIELPPPPEWQTQESIAQSLGKKATLIEELSGKYREQHPEWFHKYRSRGPAGYSEYFSPELVAAITEDIQSRPNRRPGRWMTHSEAALHLSQEVSTIKALVERYRLLHPDWFQMYLDRSKKISEHFSPELITEIRQELTRQSSPPEGWLTRGQMRDALGYPQYSVKIISERFRESKPEWFRVYKDRTGKPSEFLAPELVNEIRREIDGHPRAPEGWMNTNELANQIGRSFQSAKRLADAHRQGHPEWFELYNNRSGHNVEHYSPELIQAIYEELGGREPAPEGWTTQREMVNLLGRSGDALKRFINERRPEHPDWFHYYSAPDGRVFEYLSPECAAALEAEFSKRQPAPEGWLNRFNLISTYGYSGDSIDKTVDRFREQRPDWFGTFDSKTGAQTEYFSPELVEQVKDEMARREPTPEGWRTKNTVANELSISRTKMDRIVDGYRDRYPKYIYKYRDTMGKPAEHISPELIAIIAAEVRGVKDAPKGWLNNNQLATSLSRAYNVVEKRAEKYRQLHPEWFQMFRDASGRVSEHYSPELVHEIRTELGARQRAPEGWMTNWALTKELSVQQNAPEIIVRQYRETHPEWFHEYDNEHGQAREHYSPQLIAIIREELLERDAERVPEGWLNLSEAAELVGVHPATLRPRLEEFRETHPLWFGMYLHKAGQRSEHFAPELVEMMKVEFGKRQRAPEGWLGLSEAAENIGVDPKILREWLNSFRREHPSWFHEYLNKVNRLSEYYSPELIEEVQHQFESRPPLQRKQLQEAEAIFKNLSNPETSESRDFRNLVNIFGTSHAVDLLYRLHPSFRRIPADRVSGMLAHYLGDFLLLKAPLNIDGIRDVENLDSFLTDADLREGLVEVVKSSCLAYYQEGRRAQPDREAQKIFNEYFSSLRSQIGKIDGTRIGTIIDEAKEYYDSLLTSEQMPGRIVPQLREGRVFPDINQRINIKEISEKHRVLIGDEMGLGKSASAILSKEHLGVGCALVVAPSNVLPTWELYLSDRKDAAGRQLGYFNPGEAPRVLTVESVDDLKGLDTAAYDYVLLSQERLNERHMERLKNLRYDMLIVDEVHKLKNVVSGKRSQSILDLARRLEGEDQYLVMLSGTPVPNKVGDLALLLKMLYPEKFGQTRDDDLVRSIIYGDVVEIRNLLVPRMQLKRLQESLDMPPLAERNITIDLSREEKEIYEVLLEEDELTASEKITTLRQFLLNPELLEVAPDVSAAKVVALSHELNEALAHHDTVLVYVNGYVENVIRGDRTVLRKLALPEGVEVCVIDGSTPKAERLDIQQRIRQGGEKLLVVVSGQTADVGVDFSQANHVIFYNEPWTEYDKEQQLGRVYREGHQSALESRTLIVNKTIEDGIHQYINAKQKAIEKVLRGIPRTEMENRLLERDEHRPDQNLEVDPELAEYYFSAWDRMLRIFGHVREMGEAEFRRFLEVHGEAYADCYSELGSRTYQANNSRVVASLLTEMIKNRESGTEVRHILDIASGPEILKKHIDEDSRNRIVSLDINRHHFTTPEGKKVVGSFTRLPFRNNSMDYCNLALSLHYTKFLPSRNEFERLQVLNEMNRVLKVGGRGVISMIYNIEFKDDTAARNVMEALGFRIVDEYSGDVESGDKYQAHILTLEKVQDVHESRPGEKTIEDVAESVPRNVLDGLKFKRQKGFRLKHSRRIIHQATLRNRGGQREVPIIFNDADLRIYQEEQAILTEGRSLIAQHRGIEQIPVDVLRSGGFSRLIAGKHFILFKKLQKGEGAVIARE